MSVVSPPLIARPPRGGMLDLLAYLGGLALLVPTAARSLVRPRGGMPSLVSAVVWHLDRNLLWGLPLVALVLGPLGSYLAMQAFFSATFREAAGAVVGLGLVRSLAPMLSGFILAGLLAARIVPELRRRPRTGLDEESGLGPDRDVTRGLHGANPLEIEDDPGRLVAARIIAASITGPVLAVSGAFVGFLTGLTVSKSLLNVEPGIFVNKCLEMIEPGDLFGLVVKSIVFGLISSLLACHEGLRGGNSDSDPVRVTTAGLRAVLLALVAILVVNDCWFVLEYLSGRPFGPTLAAH